MQYVKIKIKNNVMSASIIICLEGPTADELVDELILAISMILNVENILRYNLTRTFIKASYSQYPRLRIAINSSA